jgi:hypothetical protein
LLSIGYQTALFFEFPSRLVQEHWGHIHHCVLVDVHQLCCTSSWRRADCHYQFPDRAETVGNSFAVYSVGMFIEYRFSLLVMAAHWLASRGEKHAYTS